jgi:hypothetical protein
MLKGFPFLIKEEKGRVTAAGPFQLLTGFPFKPFGTTNGRLKIFDPNLRVAFSV